MPEEVPQELEEESLPDDDQDSGEEEAEDAELSPGRSEGRGSGGGSGPRNNTQQEVGYLRRLIDQHIPVSVKIRGGELVSGVIEYYDTSFIRLTREGQSNLFVFKKDILYLREDAPVAETAPSQAKPEEPAAS
jgi:host factor-I protein